MDFAFEIMIYVEQLSYWFIHRHPKTELRTFHKKICFCIQENVYAISQQINN